MPSKLEFRCGPTLATMLGVAALAVASSARAVTFTVNSTLDQPDDLTVPGTCHTATGTCTLRAAVMQANRTTGAGATIMLPAGVYTLTIPGAPNVDDASGDLNLTSPAVGSPTITIQGADAATTIIDANQLSRVFIVEPNRTVFISGVTLRNGYVSASGGGGGISNFGTLQVADAVITHNTATGGGNGGGISSVGTLVVQRAIISENAAGQFGAGIYSFGTLSATDTTFDHNVALTTSVWGSGVFTQGNATLTNCTFRNHTGAARGGAVYVYDTSTQATVSGSTFDANSGERGGAIAVDKATLHVASSRFTGNAATWGGGVFVVNGGTAVANDTTFRNNNAFIGGAIASYGGNVTVSGSTMSGATQGGYGGGVHSEGAGATLGILNSTISGNAVSVSGGGVMNQLGSTAQLWDVSVLFNTADSDGDFVGAGGGVYNAADSSLTLANSLVAGNTVSASPTLDDCWGTISTNGMNLFSGLPNCTIPGSWGTINNLALIDPVLQNNGGPTETHALLPGSNAIGSGSLNWCLVVDQRGFARPGAGSACSVGAYEYFPPTLDVDGNGSYAPGFDGLLVLRYLFGWRGDALIAGALGANPGRSTPADVLSWLAAIHAALDVDGNGQRDALTDGVMIVRYLFGLRGAALISGALGPNPTRDASAIEAHIQSLMP